METGTVQPEPILVVPYDLRWPEVFAALAARVRHALGDELAVSVEHVGSTSVPGLAAKPVIDIDVVIPTAADLPIVIVRLAAIGYVHEGDKGLPGRDAFLWPPGEVRHHLYVCPKDSLPLYEHLLFRDYLRAHPEEVLRYNDLKRDLAVRFRDNRLAYSEAKTEYVLGVLKKAGYKRDMARKWSFVIQNQQPDQYFSREQITRLETLMTLLRAARDQNRNLPEHEQTELEELIDTELRASAKRSAALAEQVR